MSTPRSLDLPDFVRSVILTTPRGVFAALQAQPASGVCEREPAILVPGYTGSKEDFIPVLRPLAAAGRCVTAIDMRGQYQSAAAARRDHYTPDELAADIGAVADAIAPDEDEVHLLGHSLGGLIARHAVLTRAAGIGSLTLLGSGPGSITGSKRDLLRSMLARARNAGSPGHGTDHGPDHGTDSARLRGWAEQLWAEHLEPQARAEGVAEHIVAFLRNRHLANCPTALVVMGNYLLSCPDRTAELARVAGPPILVMYGENDDAWPPEVQDRMGRRLRAQRVCIPGAAHSPAIEAPETTASTLTSFWNTAEEVSRRRRRETHRARAAPSAGLAIPPG
ncbi:MAG: alpha/beta hydrolase [Streptosporangiaceae bacterium]